MIEPDHDYCFQIEAENPIPLKIKEVQCGLFEYVTTCTVETNIPVTPDDELRHITRKTGVLVQSYINDAWIRVGIISNWYTTDGDITLKCIQPHPYELPIRVTINKGKVKTQLSMFDVGLNSRNLL